MAEDLLKLNLLGNLAVIRDGSLLPLPPSKKTRALLAYLAMNSRQFRREYLCELLWEIPDDPRGSLRWSLSKIRGIVDSEIHSRILADRNYVRFNPVETEIDVQTLYSLASSDLDRVPIEELKWAADLYSEQFLEGLELTNFYNFYSWCVAERDKVAHARGRILGTIVSRLQETPEQALHYARSMVINSPYEETVRARLIRLLVETNHQEEAEQQYLLGKRMLEEVGAEPTGQLFQAWRGTPGESRIQPTRETRRVDTPLKRTGTLTGRDEETAQLAGIFSRVCSEREAHFVLVSGAPGIGKTRLLESASKLGKDNQALVLRAGAFESESLRPFAIWLDALRGYDPDAEKAIFDAEVGDNRDHLLTSLSDYLASRCQDKPVLVVFDDVQWCDESSVAALGFIAGNNSHQAMLVVMAGRPSELNDNTSLVQTLRKLRSGDLLHEIRLGPLPEEAVLSIIREQAPDVDSEELSRESQGNPLLAIELARAVSAGGSHSSLDEMIRERMSRFDLQATDVLRWAAVLGKRIDIATLVKVTGMTVEEIGDALDLAEKQALLVAENYGFSFSHDLIARSIYHEISPTRLRVMHRKVAELLEKNTALDLSYAADLAYHAALSGDAALAARALVSAGRLCLRFFANQEALSLAHKGLQLVSQLGEGERVCLTLEFRDIEMTAAPLEDWETAASEFLELAEKALDHGAIPHARLGYYMASHLHWYHGKWAGAREDTLQAERISRSGSEEDQIVGMAEAAKCLAMLEQDLSHADAMLMEARAMAERRHFKIEAIPNANGMLRYHENRLDEAEELFKDARTLAKSAGDRISEFQANEYLVMIDFERGHYQAALDRSRELVELGEKLRGGSEAPFARAIEGLCRYAVDDDAERLDSALQDLRDADAKHRLAYVLTRAALLDNERGRWQRARERAHEALTCAEALDRSTEILLANIALAEANLGTKNKAAYRQNLAAVASLEQAPVADWARNRASRLLNNGKNKQG